MSLPTPDALSSYPVVLSLPVQWGDQDAFGHVNNTVYFRWFESARIRYLEHIDLGEKGVGQHTPGEVLGPILAAINCNYRRQLKYPDTVQIGTRITRIGRSSMTMEQAVWSSTQEAIVADGQSTIVAFDYQANRPREVPAGIRKMIEKIEGKDLS